MCVILLSLFTTQPVIDVKNIIVIFIIITFIVSRLAGLGENTARIMRRLVSELWVAKVVRRCDMRRQAAQRLNTPKPCQLRLIRMQMETRRTLR